MERYEICAGDLEEEAVMLKTEGMLKCQEEEGPQAEESDF